MKFFPTSTLQQLEFNKIKEKLSVYCRSDFAKYRADNLRIHTKKEFIEVELKQTNEFKIILESGEHFPNEFIFNISKELKLLGIPGAALASEQFLLIRRLDDNTAAIFRWFDNERRILYPFLSLIIKDSYHEKEIKKAIDDILDETGLVRDTASEELASIRMNLFRKRNELRRMFDRLVSKLNKQGYLADIEESFMNGRRVLAVVAEQKRMIKGVLHGESDSRRTSFIEPEETTELNNAVFPWSTRKRKRCIRS